ncbi:MAG: hypothetical protein E6G89_16995 [Alphaproteobacteria bacterium]|nr:MAG: hypothetical protein E6G89_16995 [Alphaproteobacteria bacterium]
MPATNRLPNIGEVLAPVLKQVPADQQPLLIALTERMAAGRYRDWAANVVDPQQRSLLLACAAREDEVATLIESLYPQAAAMQRKILMGIPDLAETTQALFAAYDIQDQYRLQAQGERLGASTWRSFAKHTTDPRAAELFMRCALLEEESAVVLESVFGSGADANAGI